MWNRKVLQCAGPDRKTSKPFPCFGRTMNINNTCCIWCLVIQCFSAFVQVSFPAGTRLGTTFPISVVGTMSWVFCTVFQLKWRRCNSLAPSQLSWILDGGHWSPTSRNCLKAKFHYAIWSQTGSKLVADCSELKFGLSFSSLAASYHERAGLWHVRDQLRTCLRVRPDSVNWP